MKRSYVLIAILFLGLGMGIDHLIFVPRKNVDTLLFLRVSNADFSLHPFASQVKFHSSRKEEDAALIETYLRKNDLPFKKLMDRSGEPTFVVDSTSIFITFE